MARPCELRPIEGLTFKLLQKEKTDKVGGRNSSVVEGLFELRTHCKHPTATLPQPSLLTFGLGDKF